MQIAQCQNCEREFQSNHEGQRCCSRECSVAWARRQNPQVFGGPGKPGICPHCGGAFVNRKASESKRFCSARCYHESRRGKPTKIPPSRLGATRGQPSKLRGKSLSKEHVARIREANVGRLAATLRACVECAQSYTPTADAQKYCSGRCWNIAHRRKRGVSTKRFTIPADAYQRLLERQENRCAICGVEGGSNGRGDRLAVDHIHGTERVRGLLCHQCNTAIGLFRDDRRLLAKASYYLMRKGRLR